MLDFVNKILNADYDNLSIQAVVDFFTELFTKLLGLAEDKMDLGE